MKKRTTQKKAWLTIREMVLFAMLGTLMFAFDMVMNVIPNVHLGGMLIVVYTLVYRAKALFPIYIYVFLIGLFEGFGIWWLAYLYIWAILWGAVMLLPKSMPKWLSPIVYAIVCASHGFAFGLLYSPIQMLFFGFTWEQTLLWIKIGFFTADIPHGIGNLCASLLVVPFVALLRKLDKKMANG